MVAGRARLMTGVSVENKDPEMDLILLHDDQFETIEVESVGTGVPQLEQLPLR